MRLLLDTHVFLWFISGDQRVGLRTREAIENADAVYLSVVSLWEATIKYQLRETSSARAAAPVAPRCTESITASSHCLSRKTRSPVFMTSSRIMPTRSTGCWYAKRSSTTC